MQNYDFPNPNEEKGYELFPKELENDPLVLFHGTPQKNFQNIINNGFKAFPPLESVSYAKNSAACLTYRESTSTEDFVVIAVKFETLNLPGIVVYSSDIHVYKEDIQPKILGTCVVPKWYKHV